MSAHTLAYLHIYACTRAGLREYRCSARLALVAVDGSAWTGRRCPAGVFHCGARAPLLLLLLLVSAASDSGLGKPVVLAARTIHEIARFWCP